MMYTGCSYGKEKMRVYGSDSIFSGKVCISPITISPTKRLTHAELVLGIKNRAVLSHSKPRFLVKLDPFMVPLELKLQRSRFKKLYSK